MRKEYRTISEVVGPLMLVKDVEGVKYDELVEIEQADGAIRRGRVLEINGDKAMVQLFEGSQGLRISDSKARFWVTPSSLTSHPICSAASSTAWASRRTAVPR